MPLQIDLCVCVLWKLYLLIYIQLLTHKSTDKNKNKMHSCVCENVCAKILEFHCISRTANMSLKMTKLVIYLVLMFLLLLL